MPAAAFMPLDRGLTTAQLSTESPAGGLLYASGLTYKQGSRGIHKAEGRANYISQKPASFTGPIRGLTTLRTGTLNRLLVVANGHFFHATVTEDQTKLVEIASGYDRDADWTFTQFAGRVYGANGVDQPIVYDGLTISDWGASRPLTAPSAVIDNDGSPLWQQPVTPDGFLYTYTFAEVVDFVRIRESDPPISTVDIAFAPLTGPVLNNTGNRISGFEALPSWANTYVIYRTQDGGAEFLEIATTEDDFYIDRTDSGAEAPGTVLLLEHQPPTKKAIGPFTFAGKIGFWEKDELGIFYSIALEPHHFPLDPTLVDGGRTHFIGFNETGSARTYGAARVNRILVVGLDDGITYAERLADSADPLFVQAYSVRQGEVVGTVHSEDSFVGPRAWCQLQMHTDEDAVFFVSRLGRGLAMTNGYQTTIVAPNFRWDETVVNPKALDKIECFNNTSLWRIEIMVPSPGSDVPDHLYYYHYHPSQLLGSVGGFPLGPISGPFPRKISHSTMVIVGGRKFAVTGSSVEPKIFYETGLDDDGVAQPINLRTSWLVVDGTTEQRVLTVTPRFEGRGRYDLDMTVRTMTGKGKIQRVSVAFKGNVTEAAGSDLYGVSSVERPSAEVRPKFINRVGWAVQVELTNSQLGADLALLGFNFEYDPEGLVKAMG